MTAINNDNLKTTLVKSDQFPLITAWICMCSDASFLLLIIIIVEQRIAQPLLK